MISELFRYIREIHDSAREEFVRNSEKNYGNNGRKTPKKNGIIAEMLRPKLAYSYFLNISDRVIQKWSG